VEGEGQLVAGPQLQAAPGQITCIAAKDVHRRRQDGDMIAKLVIGTKTIQW
jgi:hypothetical protein